MHGRSRGGPFFSWRVWMTESHKTEKPGIAVIITLADRTMDNTPSDLMWVARYYDATTERMRTMKSLGIHFQYSAWEARIQPGESYKDAAARYCNEQFWVGQGEKSLLPQDFKHVGGFETEYANVGILYMYPMLWPERIKTPSLRAIRFIPVDEARTLTGEIQEFSLQALHSIPLQGPKELNVQLRQPAQAPRGLGKKLLGFLTVGASHGR